MSRSPRSSTVATLQRLSTSAGEAFHHQPRAAACDVRDDGGAAMNFGDHAKIDGEGELDSGAFLQTHVGGFDKHAIRAEIFGATQSAGATGD